MDAVGAQHRHHRLPAVLALIERHHEGSGECIRRCFDIVRVDNQSTLELVGGARKLRQNEHPGIIRRLRCHIFLGH